MTSLTACTSPDGGASNLASAKTLSSVIHLSIVDSLTLPVNKVIRKKTTMNHLYIHVDINLVSSSIACVFVSWVRLQRRVKSVAVFR